MTELLLQVDPAALSTAQQKGVDFYRRRVYTKATVRKSHKLLLVAMLQEARLLGITPYCGPVTAWRVCVEYIYRPRTLRRKDFGAPKTTRPDLDNLTKSVLDALTESGLAFSDDSQVAALEMSKRYAWGFDSEPYIRLTFGPLNYEQTKMSYGLPYMGSKSRIADKILDLIPPGDTFVDLFAGGCAVTHAAILRKQYRRYIVNDITDYPDLFLRACRGEIKMEQARWISREEFHAQKETDPLIRHLWSFGSRGEDYAYSREIEPYKRATFDLLTAEDLHERRLIFRKTITALFRYLREESGGALTLAKKQDKNGKVDERFAYTGGKNERKGKMNSSQSISRIESVDALTRLERVVSLAGLTAPEVYRLDYRAVPIPQGAIVYADPPYAGRREYKGAKGFDSAAFFDWARACPHPVFFSEYSAPQDFALIASFKVPKLLDVGRRKETYATERLYANPPALALFKEARRDLFTEETL